MLDFCKEPPFFSTWQEPFRISALTSSRGVSEIPKLLSPRSASVSSSSLKRLAYALCLKFLFGRRKISSWPMHSTSFASGTWCCTISVSSFTSPRTGKETASNSVSQNLGDCELAYIPFFPFGEGALHSAVMTLAEDRCSSPSSFSLVGPAKGTEREGDVSKSTPH